MASKEDFVSGNIDYHDTLNPIAWDDSDKLRSEVQLKLLEIARVFVKYLDIPNFEVVDIVLTGSMANYNYTKYSDFDIHVVTHYANLQSDEIAEAFYRAKKEIWNNEHDIKIRGHEAELYVEDSETPPVSGGVYSILRDEWINKPEYDPPRINNTAVNAKVKDLVRQIAHAIKDGDINDIERIRTKIRNMRKSGLARAGEFGVENLAFKILRNEGYLDKLHKAYIALQDQELSLEGQINEGASSILYHFASIRSALNILNTKHFELSSVTGNKSEEQYAPKDHPYFLSLTRTRVGDYHRYVGTGGVLFVLDGTWFNRNHKVTPIDYWERAWQHSPDRSREAEDRVFSKTPTIPIDSVQEVHVLLKEQDKWRSPEARQLMIASKKSGIPTYFYVDEKNWRLLNKAKSISVKDSGGVLSGQMPTKPMYSPERDYLEPWLELIYKNNKADLSDRAEKTRYNLVYYGSRYRNEDSGLGGDLSNARKPDQGASRRSAIKIIDYMLKNGHKTPLDLKNFLSDKWEKIAELDRAKAESFSPLQLAIMEGGHELSVTDLEKDLENPHSYDAIDHMMQTIAKEHGITAKKLHDLFVAKHGKVPDEWVNKSLEEARTNPDQNVKYESGMKELAVVAKTINDPQNWAISMTSEPKLGINPQVGISEDTPKGIYFYPLDYALDKTRYGKLPWGNDYPYIQLFQYDRSGEMTKETQVDPTELKQALSQYCSEEVIQSAIDEPEYDGTPYWFIYDCLSRLGKNDETNVVRWNKVLRDLGFTSVYDDGDGWIAYNEPTQGVVLDPRVIKQLKTITNKKQSKVVTPAVIEQAIFEAMDMELASNRAWQAYDPDGSKLRAAAKEYAKKPEFKQYYGKPGTEEIFNKAEGMGRYGARQLSQEAWEWWQEQKAQKTESINEGGWASTETQDTVITPKTVAEIVETLKGFEKSYNIWQANNGYDTEIKMGNPKGSGTYYRRDLSQDPTREYGDVDIECFIHSRDGVKSAQRTTEYKMAITEYCLQSPDYSTENGTNIIMRTTDGPVQVDLLYTYHEHANWSRALSPEYRVKGVISTSLTSALAEVLNLSFSSQGIQVKIRNNQPVSFRQSKDTELRTVSTDPENWAKDIYSLYYYLAHGEKPSEFPGGLEIHSGLKDEQRLSDIVLAIKSLGNALEETNMLGHGALIGIPTKQDLIRKIASVYSNKLETAENSSKFDKAQTPAAVEKAKKTKLMLAKYRNEITKLLLN